MRSMTLPVCRFIPAAGWKASCSRSTPSPTVVSSVCPMSTAARRPAPMSSPRTGRVSQRRVRLWDPQPNTSVVHWPCSHPSTRQLIVVSRCIADALSALKPQLAPYKMPREVVFVVAIPKSASEKILRRVLRQRALTGE
eukprot:1181691-Prymnesium_polylepis.1